MSIICQKCGDTGFFELLIYCNACQLAAEHRYCLDELPESDDEKVVWSCEECKKKAPNVASLNMLNLDKCKKNECDHGNLRCIGGPGAAPYPQEKKSRKLKDSISCTEAKTKASSIRYPCNVYVEDASGSAGLLSYPSLPKDGNECLRSGSEKSEGGGKIKKQRRRLILSDEDGSDQESEVVKLGQSCTLGLYSSKDVPGCSASPLACTEDPDQSANRLQAISAGASESEATTSVPDSQNALSNISCHQTEAYYNSYVHAQPIIDPVWRGCFNIHDCSYGMIVSHLSNKACSKVFEGASMLSPILSVEKLPRVDAWPNSFQRSPPTDDNIGLYFFPESERDETLFYQLLHDINDGDLALKVIFDEAELLIFSSLLLPMHYSRFRGRYYLWGAFRGRSVSLLQRPGDGQSPENSIIERPVSISTSDEKSIEHVHSLDKQINSWEERDGKEANDMKGINMEGQSPCSYYDTDMVEKGCDELKLFPLEVEDMAVLARMGGSGVLDLELGLGWNVSEDGEESLGFKSRRGGTGDASLALDKAVF